MSSDLLDDILVKVAGVSKKAIRDVEGVLHSLKDIVDRWQQGPLTKLVLLDLECGVNVLHPLVVQCSSIVLDVVLEDDDI